MACSKFSSVKNLASGYPGEYGRCRLMKVYKNVADPIIAKILFDITEDKKDGETLKEYALRQGMTLKLFESIFSEDHEIKTIHENPDDFHYFDQTLKFKCIRVFMDFNSKLVYNVSLNCRIIILIDTLKNIRNNKLCHNRESLTEAQCQELARSLKVPLVGLIEIIKHTWDKSINIPHEENKIEISINQIMKEPLSLDDFRYMCLQIVIKFIAEPAIYTITKLICYDNKEDNYQDYILNKGISKRKFKDGFYSEEQKLLHGKSSEIKPDLTLCSKIIMICKDWHYKLNKEAKIELSILIGNTRCIRNLISHRMLSMTPDECKREAQHLGNCLTELGMFAQKMNLYEGLDVPKIDIDQIAIDINYIMLIPYS